MAKKPTEPLWTIAELTGRVSDALGAGFEGVANGRVRDVPDLRAIRYYTTIGLIDRPAEMRGRTAYYGRRHLCQLVAIKRLQSQGLSLAQIQQRLLNLGNRELENIAAVDRDGGQSNSVRGQHAELRDNVRARLDSTAGDQAVRSAMSAATPPARREDFWRAPPGPVQTPAADLIVQQAARPEVVTLVPLSAGLSIGFEANRAINAEDIAALQAAARPLLQLLIERHLVGPELEKEKHGEDAPHTESR